MIDPSFIAALAQRQTLGRQVRLKQRLVLFLAAALVVAFHVATLGVRPDLTNQIAEWPFLAKLAALSLFLISGFLLLWEQTRPDARAQRGLWALVILGGAVSVALPLPQANAVGQEQLQCAFWIFLYALPALVLAGLVVRRRAPLRPLAASLALGTVAWASSALGYALHCQADLPLGAAYGNITMLGLYLLAWPALCLVAYGSKPYWMRW